MITVEDLSKRYARQIAVDRVSFEVGKGQIVGFLGPNGAGKTTTMRMLTCFLPPTSGTARVAGFDVQKQPQEVKKRIGYLPETPPLYPEMEVGEYLDFVGKLKGIPSNEVGKRVGEACERCQLTDVRKKLIAKLSKGYRQRVGLAQAIIHNPDVLILDEPTSGLDPKQIIETRSLIRSLAGDHTIILSTHILPEVEQTCERVVIITKGHIVATDTVENLTHRLSGTEAITLELANAPAPEAVREQLERVPGVGRVVLRDTLQDGLQRYEVESQQGQSIRSELARAVVQAGWSLHELRGVSLSLEQVFLELTNVDPAQQTASTAPQSQTGAQA